MVCFDNGTETIRILNGNAVANVNANLTGSDDLTTAYTLTENLKICFIGTKKAGAFDIDAEFAMHLLQAPLNPNSRPNSDVVFPWLNGKMIAGREPEKWIISFGDMTKCEPTVHP